MFGKIGLGNFKSQAETVQFKLHFVDGRHVQPDDESWEPPVLHEFSHSWTIGEAKELTVTRLEAALQAPECWQDLAVLRLVHGTESGPSSGLRPGFLVRAATFGLGGAEAPVEHVSVRLEVQRRRLTLYGLEVVSGALPASDGGLAAALEALPLDSLRWLRWGGPGATALWRDPALLARLASTLARLDLRGAALGTLPPGVGALRALRSLDVSGCGLKILPPALGLLTDLRRLRADGNEISLLPGELARCTALRTLSLEGNRLTHVPLNFGALRALRELDLFGNPLEVLPEIGACTELRRLSVLNLRVSVLEAGAHSGAGADGAADPWRGRDTALLRVELLPIPGQSYGIWGESRRSGDRLRPMFELMLRRSAGHHPLLAGALRHLAAEDPKHRVQMVQQEGALQQLLLMALADDERIALETCRTLCLIAAHSPALAEAVAATDVAPILSLLEARASPRVTVAALRVLSAVALSSTAAGARVATAGLLDALQRIVCAADGDAAEGLEGDGDGGSEEGEGLRDGQEDGRDDNHPPTSPRPVGRTEVLAAALEAVGNLCFGERALGALRARPALMAAVDRLAFRSRQGPAPRGASVRAGAVRVLAILGDNAAVQRALGRPGPSARGGRGVRILSMDGGGMKGLAAVRMLRELEARSGRRVHELFDLVVGTSTGGLLAVALALRRLTLDDCEAIYKVLGRRVFSSAPPKDKEESWVDAVYRSLHSRTQHVRAVVVGYKHDSALYEQLLKEYCDVRALVRSGGEDASSAASSVGKGAAPVPPPPPASEPETDPRVLGPALIDTAPLDAPRVALVATLASVTPAVPYVFRNYEFAPDLDALVEALGAHRGSSRHAVWQAARASSAATYYLDGFECAGERFQDGAVTINNPALVALQEAQLLWPGAPIDALVSIGTGAVPAAPRPAAVSSFVETGAILIESATAVERVAEGVAAVANLIPGLRYFRFQPTDARCAMALDEIRPEAWAGLEMATEEYIAATEAQWDDAAATLVAGLERGADAPAVREPRAAAAGTLRLLRLAQGAKLIHARCTTLGQALRGEGKGARVAEHGVSKLAASPSPSPRRIDLATDELRWEGPVREVGSAQTNESGPIGGADAETSHKPDASGAAPSSPASAAQETPSGLSDYFSSWFSPSKASTPTALDAEHRRKKRPRSPVKRPPEPPSDAVAAPRFAAALRAPVPASEHERPAIVLDLPLTADGDAMVLGWASSLVSVVSSGPEEEAWARRLGAPLDDVFAEGPEASLPGAPDEGIACVSVHSQWLGGSSVKLRLLRHVHPAARLSAQQVAQGAFGASLVGCLVVAPRSDEWAEALLRGAGAAAVISPVPDKTGGMAPAAVQALSSALLAGESLAAILDRVEGLQVACLDDRGLVARHGAIAAATPDPSDAAKS